MPKPRTSVTHWRRRIAVYLGKHHLEGPMLLGTAVFVGFAAAIGAIVFRWLIETVSHLSFEVLPRLTGSVDRLHLVEQWHDGAHITWRPIAEVPLAEVSA